MIFLNINNAHSRTPQTARIKTTVQIIFIIHDRIKNLSHKLAIPPIASRTNAYIAMAFEYSLRALNLSNIPFLPLFISTITQLFQNKKENN